MAGVDSRFGAHGTSEPKCKSDKRKAVSPLIEFTDLHIISCITFLLYSHLLIFTLSLLKLYYLSPRFTFITMSLLKFFMLAAPGLVLGQTKSLTALTFNIAGLPEIIQTNDVEGDKTENTGAIGDSMAKNAFDFINVQEDFNYHAALVRSPPKSHVNSKPLANNHVSQYETDNHKFRTATSGGVPFGSGLNTLSNFDFGDKVERITWDKTSSGSGDGLTPKGFTMVRAQVDSATIDVYNLHTDAG